MPEYIDNILRVHKENEDIYRTIPSETLIRLIRERLTAVDVDRNKDFIGVQVEETLNKLIAMQLELAKRAYWRTRRRNDTR